MLTGNLSLQRLKLEQEARRRGLRTRTATPKTFREYLPEVSPPLYRYDWPYLVLLIDALEQVAHGECRRLMIFMPPRHGKSETTTVRFPAYLLDIRPELRGIVAAYNQTFAEKFSRKIRRIVGGRKVLSKERKAVSDWETAEEGGIRAAGVGGGVTGNPADFLIIDDPVKSREEANSKTYREKVWDWYTDDLYTRLEPGAPIILIMTRWHEDDLAGRILASSDGPNWTVINLPALAEDNDPLGRAPGEALCPARYPVEVLEQIRTVLGSSFQALYQQRPAAQEGEIFKRAWWRYYTQPPEFRRIIQAWDTGFKKGEDNDPSACTTWGETATGIYLLDFWMEKVEFPELKRAQAAQYAKWLPSAVIIEDKASGQSLIQELQRQTICPVIPIQVKGDKESRAHAVTPAIEAGNVYLPEFTPKPDTDEDGERIIRATAERTAWLADYVDHMAVFPMGDHDDAVDSTTLALKYIYQGGGGVGLLDFYEDEARRLLEEAEAEKSEQP